MKKEVNQSEFNSLKEEDRFTADKLTEVSYSEYKNLPNNKRKISTSGFKTTYYRIDLGYYKKNGLIRIVGLIKENNRKNHFRLKLWKIVLKILEEEIKRQKQEKENDNANNTRSIHRNCQENDKTEPREISQSSSLSDPKRNGDIPLWLLWDLAITCKQLDLKENYQKVLVEIQMNLETQHKADLAEQRAEKAEQLYQQIKNFRISMMKKYQAS